MVIFYSNVAYVCACMHNVMCMYVRHDNDIEIITIIILLVDLLYYRSVAEYKTVNLYH